MNRSTAQIVREYGPFSDSGAVHGVTYDGQHVWFASGDKLNAFDPVSGAMLRSIDVPMRERLSMVSTSFNLPKLASRRSIPKQDA
jgi:hypothetical protein